MHVRTRVRKNNRLAMLDNMASDNYCEPILNHLLSPQNNPHGQRTLQHWKERSTARIKMIIAWSGFDDEEQETIVS